MVPCGALSHISGLCGTAEAVPFHGSSWVKAVSVQGNPICAASAESTEILRWESLALRAAPLPQDDTVGLAEGRGQDGVHGSPDSAAQRFWRAKLLPWGKFEALRLGEGEMYSVEFGESRATERLGWVIGEIVFRTPFGGAGGANGRGVLRLRMRFASRSACCAQDDSANTALRGLLRMDPSTSHRAGSANCTASRVRGTADPSASLGMTILWSGRQFSGWDDSAWFGGATHADRSVRATRYLGGRSRCQASR